MSGALDSLAARVRATDPEQVARELARQSILDTAACITAGWQSPQRRAVSAMLERSGNRGAGARALLLGTAAHALDYDDFEQPGSTHPSAVLVPAILAVAASEPVTLARAEAAYVAGYEVILSLGLALGYGLYMAGWHATGTLGMIGAAGTAAHLLGLDRDRAAVALSRRDLRALKAACALEKGGPGCLLSTADLRAKLADCGMTPAVADSFLAHSGTSGFSGALILPPDIVAALP